MIVVDASVVVDALVVPADRGRRARLVMGRDVEWSAPHHLVVETFAVLRAYTLKGLLTAEEGKEAVQRLTRMTFDLVGVDDLVEDMWEMRHTVSGHDAAYVALARRRGATLVTSDLRLAAAASALCRVEAVR